MSTSDPRYRNKATLNVLAVLSAFIGQDRAYGASGLAQELGMSKNMAHRALSLLADEGFLTRDASNESYQLGPRVLELHAPAGDEFDLMALCRPFLEELHALTGESLFLSIIVGRSRINIDGIEAPGPRASPIQRGMPAPLHARKLGRMLLAFLSDAEIADYVRLAAPLEQFPETRQDNVGELMADLELLRRERYAVWRGTRLFSAGYATFPVLDTAGRPHAVITVGGPLERFPLARAQALVPRMQQVMARLNLQSRLYPATPVHFQGE